MVSLFLLCLASTPPGEVPARTQDPAFVSDRDTTLVVGQVVRLRLTNARLVEGTVLALPRDAVVVARAGGHQRVPRAEITDIWTREPAYRAGARRGAVMGGLLFGLAGAAISVGLCDAAECPVDAAVTVAGLGIGALMGAVTGGVLGAFGDEWVRRFP